MPKVTPSKTAVKNTSENAAAKNGSKSLANGRAGKKSAAPKSGDEELAAGEGSASPIAIEDPVRMYLMQMGEIPLLNRDQEIAAAQRIEAARSKYRYSMLATDFMLHAAVTALEKCATASCDWIVRLRFRSLTRPKRNAFCSVSLRT